MGVNNRARKGMPRVELVQHHYRYEYEYDKRVSW